MILGTRRDDERAVLDSLGDDLVHRGRLREDEADRRAIGPRRPGWAVVDLEMELGAGGNHAGSSWGKDRWSVTHDEGGEKRLLGFRNVFRAARVRDTNEDMVNDRTIPRLDFSRLDPAVFCETRAAPESADTVTFPQLVPCRSRAWTTRHPACRWSSLRQTSSRGVRLSTDPPACLDRSTPRACGARSETDFGHLKSGRSAGLHAREAFAARQPLRGSCSHAAVPERSSEAKTGRPAPDDGNTGTSLRRSERHRRRT